MFVFVCSRSVRSANKHWTGRMFVFGSQTNRNGSVRFVFGSVLKKYSIVRFVFGQKSGVSPTLLWMPDVLVAAVSATQDKNCGQRTILLPTIDEERERFPKLKTLHLVNQHSRPVQWNFEVPSAQEVHLDLDNGNVTLSVSLSLCLFLWYSKP